jgi:hypothetical protein
MIERITFEYNRHSALDCTLAETRDQLDDWRILGPIETLTNIFGGEHTTHSQKYKEGKEGNLSWAPHERTEEEQKEEETGSSFSIRKSCKCCAVYRATQTRDLQRICFATV